MSVDKKIVHNQGVTLVELMVYIVLGVLVVSYAMATMKSVSKQYVHGREVAKMQQNGRDAINIIARDLVNTGFKYYIYTWLDDNGNEQYETRPKRGLNGSADTTFLYASYNSKVKQFGVYSDSTVSADSAASFLYWNTSNYPGDEIITYRSKLVRSDSVGSVERVRYYLDTGDSTLYRAVDICDNTNLCIGGNIVWKDGPRVGVVENVIAFQLQFSSNGIVWEDAPIDKAAVKYVRVELVIHSERESAFGGKLDTNIVGDYTIPLTGDSHLYRKYSRVIPMVNNGIVR